MVLTLRLTDRAFRRKLRHDQTDVERKLWSLLRSRQLESYKFRRQHSIGRYVVDFCCLERRVIIELDGGQHQDQADYDEKRTQFLETKGFRVIRVWDNEVFQQTDAMVEKIESALNASEVSFTSPRAEVY